ncbi:MAG: hypothetical protein F4Z61_07995 [Acidimicrobiia bacterium]|nr:hypothetical protein [Acidimicrobiia bacterium]
MNAGRLILMGSGEVSNRLVAAHRLGVERAGAREAVVLDTPYGFQENAPLLSERLTGFFRTSLSIDASVASYRSTSEGEGARERMLAAVRRARYVFAGPGSPGYALATWRTTGLAAALRKRLTEGATVTLASAAALTAGPKTLPVYEIFKAGAGLEWLEGMNLAAHLGLEAVVIPHWNNTEGQGFDTSRCYMGRRRFRRLRAMLPDRMGVIGVDEHTAASIDFGTGEMSVLGVGGVTLSGADDMFVAGGEAMALDTMFKLLETNPPAPPPEPLQTLPDLTEAKAARSAEMIADTLLRLESEAADGSPQARQTLRSALLEMSELAVSGLVEPAEWVGGYVELLVDARSRLRAQKRWEEADRIRAGLERLGVTLQDGPSGTAWILEEPR